MSWNTYTSPRPAPIESTHISRSDLDLYAAKLEVGIRPNGRSMVDLKTVLSALADDLSEDDVLIDCETVPLTRAELAELIEELLVRRAVKCLTFLNPDSTMRDAAEEFSRVIGVSGRLQFVEHESP